MKLGKVRESTNIERYRGPKPTQKEIEEFDGKSRFPEWNKKFPEKEYKPRPELTRRKIMRGKKS